MLYGIVPIRYSCIGSTQHDVTLGSFEFGCSMLSAADSPGNRMDEILSSLLGWRKQVQDCARKHEDATALSDWLSQFLALLARSVASWRSLEDKNWGKSSIFSSRTATRVGMFILERERERERQVGRSATGAQIHLIQCLFYSDALISVARSFCAKYAH